MGGLAAFVLLALIFVQTVSAQTVGNAASYETIIAQETERLAGHPDLLAEFWMRLAVKAYEERDFSRAGEYFSKAEEHAGKDLLQAAALYRAEIALRTDEKKGVETGAKILSDCAEKTKLHTSDVLYGKMRVTQARFAGLAQDWGKCENFSDAVLTSAKEPESKKAAVYWKAMSQFQTEKYGKACKTIESHSDALEGDSALSLLYAKALIKAGRMADADNAFASLEKGAMTDDARLDYARMLLNMGRFSASREQAEKVRGAQSLYVQALDAFNQRNWDEAAKLMAQSLKEKPALEEKYAAYAEFYCGYARYRTGNYAEAYTMLSGFIKKNQFHPLRYNALMTAARSAVQSRQAEKASDFAEQAIYAASTDEQQNEAVLLTASIYADAGKYDKALAVLSPRTTGRNQFAWQCRYEMARIQAQKKDYAAADKTYASLAGERIAGSFAEEAAYRRGELQYSLEQYAKASSVFEDYINRWTNGQFYDAALYFNAESLARLGQTDKAILYFMQADNLRSGSSYKYNAEKRLVELHRQQGNYADALAYANKMLLTYGDQARDDGMAKIADELERLSKGGNAALLKKEKEYENAGKTGTERGRIIGTELVRLYLNSSATQSKGIALAEKLLPMQTAPQESQYAAQNALLLAQHYRTNGDNKKAAQTYLSAAQYSRAAGNDDDAARALYGATEAFDAAGLPGDAKVTAESLANLYPSSNFVRSAWQIVNK